MIVSNQQEVTEAVLAELSRAPDARFREIMSAAVRHLHDFARDARLTEAEFHQACAIIARLGQLTTESHNEVVLIAGSLGLSSLVCLLNNGDHGQTETTANLMGPFWRMDSPRTENGGSDRALADARCADLRQRMGARSERASGRRRGGGRVATSADGYYENQDPEQADMNLRGKFTTDANGHIAFRSVKPAGYPIPVRAPSANCCVRRGATTCGPRTSTS